MRFWWERHGTFAPGSFAGYPAPGQVVAYYRKRRGMSRAKLASMLGVTVSLVCQMEGHHVTLDGVERLRRLQGLLAIPPELLGLTDPPGGQGPWWWEYDAFPAGEDGFPLPGSVIRHYRKRKGWKQLDLAEAVNLSEMAIRRMEKQSFYLDSLTRRRALSHLLNIPPVLLGLDTAHLFVPPPVVPASASVPDLSAIQAVQTSLWTGYYAGHAREQLAQAQNALAQVKAALPSLSTVERPVWLEQQSLLLQGIVNIVREYADTSKVLVYANKSVEVARLSKKNADCIALALNRRAFTLYEYGYFEQAERDASESLFLAQKNNPAVFSSCSLSLARISSLFARDEQDRSHVLELLDQAQVCHLRPSDIDTYGLNVDQALIETRRGQVLLHLAQNAPAPSKFLHQADVLLNQINLDGEGARRQLAVKLAQARVALGLREFDRAAYLAVEAFPCTQQIKSVLALPQFVEIYQALLRSNYAGSPQVARLGWLLVEAGAIVG